MKMRENFLSRMMSHKDPAPAEPEETYEIPSPTAIEPGVPPYSAGGAEQIDYDTNNQLELLADDALRRADSANGADTGESNSAPALGSLTAPVMDDSPDAPAPPLEVAPFKEYGLDLELLKEPESDDSPDKSDFEPSQPDEVSSPIEVAAEAPRETEETALGEVESVVKETAPETESFQEGEQEAIGDVSIENPYPVAKSIMDTPRSESEMPQVSGRGAIDDVVQQAEEPQTPSASQGSMAVDESLLEAEETASAAGKGAEEMVGPENRRENEILPLVKDARGAWRPGKGFSRSELREADLSLVDAARLGVRFDKRRRNAHPINVDALVKGIRPGSS